ncbi:hypothetical protein [Campylobacter sp. JMF_08 NE1]|uniref:hypothetical protein n=1 Tax=Campylobacter sp. JMF_08 NE1 TaxID=2983821 RepID=UPI0022E9BBEC|nr:hypothetical protein [Campylobacter sp. JMF_08 NE1]MDA3048216.1 hypothetical protein [Campylobacter sp. JMF_08 NE1]
MWLISLILWLLPISILIDYDYLEFKNKAEERLAFYVPIIFVLYLIFNEFYKCLARTNFEISSVWIFLLDLFFHEIFVVGLGLMFMVFLYIKIFKYVVRPLRSVLHEFIYVFMDFVFMQDHEDFVKKGEYYAWTEYLTQNKVSEAQFSKIAPFETLKDFENWANATNDENVQRVYNEIMKKQKGEK